MGRKRKSRGKDGTPVIKATEGVADAGQTSKTPRNRRKKSNPSGDPGWFVPVCVNKTAASRQRQVVSETPRRKCFKRRCKKAKSSSSIEFIKVLPCCPSDRERKKYAKLGLDSALFFSNSKPAKRKQSHISVITISSSDDEDANTANTADWISKMDVVPISISSTEEPFPSGDADFSHSDSMMEEIISAEKVRPQRSSTQIYSTPESTFKPLCASTPQETLSIFQPLCFSTPETEENHLLIYKGPSFLENPIKNSKPNSTLYQVTECPHTTTSIKQTQNDDEYKVKSVLTCRPHPPKFYFGPSQNLQTLQQTFENSSPMWSDLSYFSARQTSSKANVHTLDMKFRRQEKETEARKYSLEQIPSTSHAPVSVPVLEGDRKRKKKSKSKNTSPSR